MKKIYSLFFLLFLAMTINAQPVWNWVNSLSGSNSQIATPKVVSDANGFYVTGTFDGTRTFGTYTLTSHGVNDAFLARYDNQGNCTWVNHYGSYLSNTGSSAAAVDGNGDIYIAGTYTDTIVVGGTTLAPYGIIDMFLIKLNPSGNVIWAQRCGGQNQDNATALAVDAQNNVYLGGSFFFKAYFGSDSLMSSISNIIDIFITKFNPAGQMQWMRSAGGPNEDACVNLSVSCNRLYVAGTIAGPCMFGTHNITAANNDAFIAKYDLQGNNLWVKKAGGAQNDLGKGMSTDGFGNAYVIGHIIQNCTFSNSPPIIINAGNYDQIFIAKYDSSGNCLWAKKGGNGGVPNVAGGVITDYFGYSLLTGTFKGTANFSPYNLTSSGAEDICFVKYSPLGNCQYALKGGGTGIDRGYSCAWLPTNEFVVAGTYQGAATFGSFSLNVPSSTSYAIYLNKLPGYFTGIENTEIAGSVVLGPNPASDIVHIEFSGLDNPESVNVINSLGQVVMNENVGSHQSELTLDVSKLLSGLYFVKINSRDSYLTKNIQIIK